MNYAKMECRGGKAFPPGTPLSFPFRSERHREGVQIVIVRSDDSIVITKLVRAVAISTI